MGHDITAYRPGINEDELRERFRLDDHDEDWRIRYDQYTDEVEIAYNRRSAGNPLNQVLYIALGVMDEAYAGCSGNGCDLDITLEQFETAMRILEVKNFEGMERERNYSDTLMDMFRSMGANVVENKERDWDVSQEYQFCQKCFLFLKENNLPSLKVSFG